MNVFIVHAHPEPKSMNGALTRLARDVLQGQGHTVKVSDLYAMGFDPVSSRKSFQSVKDQAYFKPQIEEMHAVEQGGFAPDLQAEMDKLRWCDCLIFQFPLWWFSVPAILKGWVDRVLAMGFAYGYGHIYREGVFRGKRAMLSLTTGGGPEMYTPAGANGDIHQILFPIQHGIFYFTGMDVLPPFIAWSPARITPEQRQAYLEQYGQRLLALESTEPIRWE